MRAETGFVQVLIPVITAVAGLLGSAFAGQEQTRQASLALRAQREQRDQQIAEYWRNRAGGAGAPSQIPPAVLYGAAAVGLWLVWRATRGD